MIKLSRLNSNTHARTHARTHLQFCDGSIELARLLGRRIPRLRVTVVGLLEQRLQLHHPVAQILVLLPQIFVRVDLFLEV